MKKDLTEKTRENLIRRMADRQGLKLVKCRRRDPRALGYGLYFIVDARTNAVVAGAHRGTHSFTLKEAERFLAK